MAPLAEPYSDNLRYAFTLDTKRSATGCTYPKSHDPTVGRRSVRRMACGRSEWQDHP